MRILGLAFCALLCTSASCFWTEPGEHLNLEEFPEIAGVNIDVDGPQEVLTALGRPTATATGWWRDVHQFDMDFRVWYYKGVGRVIFRYSRTPGELVVHATEADKAQTGDPRMP